jgi:hypothetical protein
MEPIAFAKQIVDFQKVTFNNTYNTIVKLQDQSEKQVTAFLEKTWGVPLENQEAYTQWVNACKKGREEIKNTIDRSFSTVESLFTQAKPVPDVQQPQTPKLI